LSKTPIAQERRARIDKWDHIKLKTFCVAKETTDSVKRQLTEWEKTSDRFLIGNSYQEYIKNSKS
jgi:hypothetical protein